MKKTFSLSLLLALPFCMQAMDGGNTGNSKPALERSLTPRTAFFAKTLGKDVYTHITQTTMKTKFSEYEEDLRSTAANDSTEASEIEQAISLKEFLENKAYTPNEFATLSDANKKWILNTIYKQHCNDRKTTTQLLKDTDNKTDLQTLFILKKRLEAIKAMQEEYVYLEEYCFLK